jgi:glycosyltransferase involved in cell wall biosynthesis
MNKSILFLCLHRPNRSPSQRYRFEQYLEFFSQNGYQCHHVYLLNKKRDEIFYSKGNYLGKGWILVYSMWVLFKQSFLKKYDLVYIQREAFMLGSSFFERRLARRNKLVYDFDDAIWLKQTGTIKSNNKLLYFLKNPEKTQNIIKVSDMVFAGNQYLADYASRFNPSVKIIPTTIDTELYKVIRKTPGERVCIGWSGSFSTIIHFEFILPVLIELKNRFGEKVYFKVIGDPSYENESLNIKGIPWTRETEVKELSEIDIGIMPLPDDQWTRGKCGAKGLIYMSLGIPTIMSPVGVNKKIINDGINGYLAESNQEWTDKLSLLVSSFDLRIKVGNAGRDEVVKNYSVNANKQLYLDYFNELTGR